MLFITYANDDITFVQDMAAQLNGAGLAAWFDEARLKGNPVWTGEVEERLLSAEAVLVVLSPSCTASQYATFEWTSAYRAGIPVVPVLCRRSLIHPALAEATVYDFSIQREWPRLIADLRANLGHVAPQGSDDALAMVTANLPPDAVEAVRHLQAEDADTRIEAIDALAGMLADVPEVLTPLTHAMSTDPDRDVKIMAYNALREWRFSEGFIKAAVMLHHPDHQTRLGGLRALALAGDTRAAILLLPLLDDDEMRIPAIETLGKVRNTDTLPVLIDLLGAHDEQIVAAAIRALSNFGDKAAVPLSDGLSRTRHKENYVRALMSIGSQIGVRPLIFELQNDHSSYTLLVARALQSLRGENEMIQVMQTTSDNSLRRAILRALGRSKNPAMLELLLRTLPHTDSVTRSVISSTIVADFGKAALPQLQQAVKHDDWAVRDAAAGIIRELGLDPKAYGYVEHDLYD